jgi:hypothetical protein
VLRCGLNSKEGEKDGKPQVAEVESF